MFLDKEASESLLRRFFFEKNPLKNLRTRLLKSIF